MMMLSACEMELKAKPACEMVPNSISPRKYLHRGATPPTPQNLN